MVVVAPPTVRVSVVAEKVKVRVKVCVNEPVVAVTVLNDVMTVSVTPVYDVMTVVIVVPVMVNVLGAVNVCVDVVALNVNVVVTAAWVAVVTLVTVVTTWLSATGVAMISPRPEINARMAKRVTLRLELGVLKMCPAT
jgi:hypothetical protein